jgi:hypothetical protein
LFRFETGIDFRFKTSIDFRFKTSIDFRFETFQEDERVISFERGKQLADSMNLEFFETSAKENINVRVSRPGSMVGTML